MANKVTQALSGAGIWGVEFFITKDATYFSELSPRPHDTGMVTLAGTQNLNEFELHARAILGLPIPEIQLFKNGASAVLLANKNSQTIPRFDGLDEVLKLPSTDLRLFGKPSSRPFRRMGVVLKYGDENVEDLVKEAKELAAKITVS